MIFTTSNYIDIAILQEVKLKQQKGKHMRVTPKRRAKKYSNIEIITKAIEKNINITDIIQRYGDMKIREFNQIKMVITWDI